jgi:hypothetical protein
MDTAPTHPDPPVRKIVQEARASITYPTRRPAMSRHHSGSVVAEYSWRPTQTFQRSYSEILHKRILLSTEDDPETPVSDPANKHEECSAKREPDRSEEGK